MFKFLYKDVVNVNVKLVRGGEYIRCLFTLVDVHSSKPLTFRCCENVIRCYVWPLSKVSGPVESFNSLNTHKSMDAHTYIFMHFATITARTHRHTDIPYSTVLISSVARQKT